MLRSDPRDGPSVTTPVAVVGDGLQRVFGWLLASVLAGVGAVTGMVGAGLALLGVCCAGPAITVGTAATTAAGAGSVYSKSFLVSAALLGLAAFVVHRRMVHRPAYAAAGSAEGAAAPGPQPRSGSLSSGARS